MASYRLITDEDKEYISSFMDWLNENITPAQVDQEHFANCIMNIDNLMRFGSGGLHIVSNNEVAVCDCDYPHHQTDRNGREYCRKCGKDWNDEVTVCDRCGSRTTVINLTTSGRFCEKCKP